ncbi:hypothetical protein AN958_03735 [Leucoagaricus sp. SymC.cos]|nr:hypothetical protein AN958_03735 [Leucoagaricus sp. SymC.cos]
MSTLKPAGEPTSKTAESAGLKTYISEPKSGEPKCFFFFFFPDGYGPFNLHNQLMQDFFAENGFLVLGIDYFFGQHFTEEIMKDSQNTGFDVNVWTDNARTRAGLEVPKWVKAVKEHYGNDKKYAVVEYWFGVRRIADEPFQIVTNNDKRFLPQARHCAGCILHEIGATFHFRIFSGVEEGFTIRRDYKVENSRWAEEKAAATVLGFFSRYLTT